MSNEQGYWQSVLAEVLNKGQPEYTFLYTSLGPAEREEAGYKAIPENRQPKRDRIVLEGEFEGIYLTPREGDCLRALVGGRTLKAVARDLDLSHRTVEFYLKNLKAKFGCASKGALLELIASTELLSVLGDES